MISRRTVLVVVAFAAVGAVVVPTMAASLDVTGDGGDRITTPESEEIVMTPSDGPNGVYASLDENDEVAIEIGERTQERAEELGGEGVNDDSVTDIDDVFHVTYTGDEDDGWKLRITTEIEDVQFYYGDDPGNSLADETHFDADETVAVGVSVDATGDGSAEEIEGLEEFTVHAYTPDGDGSEEHNHGDAVDGDDGGDGVGGDDGGDAVGGDDDWNDGNEGDEHDADEGSDGATSDADGETTRTETGTADGDDSGAEGGSGDESGGPGSEDGDGPTDDETDDTTESTMETDGGGLTQDGLTEPAEVAGSIASSGFPLLLILLIILLGLGVTFLARQIM